ncbi:redoxin domain-containing protein [Flavobacteriaceae bacterium Ap0902]|nr:redoxin domain-containing protein [Flavobacteriaceae bacterium Ap0902]
MSAFYQLKATASTGEEIDFSNLKGKVVLIVNTATACGLANQFEGLEKLHEKYKEQGFVIIGFPSNQFAGQEPVRDSEMAKTCKINHDVTFTLTKKIDVNGKDTHPVFEYLKDQLGGFLVKNIKWNFTKFLVDRHGKPYKRYAPYTQPSVLEDDIKKLLAL